MLKKLNETTWKEIAKDDPKDRLEVIIGDDKSDKFESQIKIERWDNEVNCSIRLITDEKNPEVKEENNKIKWVGDKIESHFYNLTEGEGGYEFEVILKEKPAINKIEFTLETKGLDFHLQPTYTEEEITKFAEQGQNINREIMGSYAVYTSEEKINYTSGKEYKCGKVGQIYRPRIIDSIGTEVWGTLHIENGILSVEISQDFLDNAVYPIRHAAGFTFGYTTIGTAGEYIVASEWSGSTYNRVGAMYTCGAVGTLDNIVVGMHSNNADVFHDTTVTLNKYNDPSANNHAEVAEIERANLAFPVAAYWYIFTASSEALSAIDYVLSVIGNSPDMANFRYTAIMYDTVAGQYNLQQSVGSYTVADPWAGTLSSNSNKISIYANYTPASTRRRAAFLNI